jgi:uncharacterized membrane protein YraQ (UPF0718 family)
MKYLKMNNMKKNKFDYAVIMAFVVFAAYSFITGFAPGISIVEDNFWEFIKEMLIALPAMFVLVGLFDVWVSKEKVQKYIGKASGIKGVVLVIMLAFMQAGPLYAAFPVAYILWKKGTSPVNIFIYLAASSIAKIPMITFEIGFLGLKFSMLRIFISIPVFIVLGVIMGRYFEKHNCKINNV